MNKPDVDGPRVMKNCESFVFLVPALAMATIPRCGKRKRGCISSSKGSRTRQIAERWRQAYVPP